MDDASPHAHVGETFAETHRFTPDEVAAFSRAMGDTNPLHLDAEVAKASRYGRLIASGTHSTALLLGLTASHYSRKTTVVGVEFSVQLRRPVFADSTVTLTWTVTKLTRHPKGKGNFVDLVGAVRDEEGRDCLTGTGRVLVGLDEA